MLLGTVIIVLAVIFACLGAYVIEHTLEENVGILILLFAIISFLIGGYVFLKGIQEELEVLLVKRELVEQKLEDIEEKVVEKEEKPKVKEHILEDGTKIIILEKEDGSSEIIELGKE